ncbi:hypothetical protein D0863_03842 [Hortaea werneckii]|uniref:LRAT domain-containing protein n=1 Tax=Hortaea werneckii TaxID=91943 RepID=A0A3M7EAR9_HORWE|nr:hypothetical protein D0863_03842 [Hortaea werneckii]
MQDLQASRLSAIARRSEITAGKGKSLPGHSSPGAYAAESKKISLPATVSHWAMRIEVCHRKKLVTALDAFTNIFGPQKKPGRGRENEIRTWTYFGLANSDGKKCELDETEWEVLYSPESRICGSSNENDDKIRDMALSAMAKFGDYDLMTNKCQDFALYLFLTVANVIEHPQRLLELASERRMATQPLLTVQRIQREQEFSTVPGVTQIFDEIVADDRKRQRIFTWLIAQDFDVEDDPSGEKGLNYSLAYTELISEPNMPYRRRDVVYQLD